MSAGVHLVLLAVAAALTRPAPVPESSNRSDPAEQARRVEMIYVPPAEPTRPPPPARPAPPPRPPAVRQTLPEPEPNAPPEATRTTGTESPDETPPGRGEPKAEATPPPTAPAREQAATLESEAQRIFGRPRLMTRAGAGPQATRPMEAWLPDNSERCISHPAPPRDSAGTTEFGTVVGRIFRQDNGRPLAGAHLQMIGTPYVSFTDESGEYRFRFDLALMDNCRTQYVRVSAAGYESRLLVLVVGPNRSEDVRLRRR